METGPATYLTLYAVTLTVFLGIDVIWLKMVMRHLFDSRIGEMMREQPLIGVAAGFYAAYVAGILYFASAPALASGPYAEVFLRGAILGLLAYGTYEFTSMSVMRNWDWTMVAVDTLWGGVLTGLSAVTGLWITRLIY